MCRRFCEKTQLIERLHQSACEVADTQTRVSAIGSLRSRWTLGTLRESLLWLESYTLIGVWRVLSRCGLRIRSGRVR
ncbi:hypothetical protein F4141_07295 [Candidatus Poribacteria bacterium]|nr:hypothetical protein [Candidatus Poribacteria bacterium]